MRISFVKKLAFAPLFLSLLYALFATEKTFQDPSPPPTPSPSPSASPKPTATPTPLPGAQNFHQWGSITVFNGLPSDSVRTIAQTPDGVMWFGTDNGLARFDGRRVQNFTPGGENADQILTLKTAPNGELLIGTRAGAFVYSQNRFDIVAGTEQLAVSTVAFRENVLIGGNSGIVYRVDRNETGQFSATPMFADPIRDPDGTTEVITGLIPKEDGRVVVSTASHGVFELLSGVLTPISISTLSPVVNAAVRDEASSLWLGTDAPRNLSGLFRIDPNKAPVRIAAPTSKVLTLEANDSGIWVGTERYGLFHFADGKLKKNYTFENTSGGIRSNTVYTLFTDREGVLWIGTNRGVSRFDRLGAKQQTVSDSPNSNFVRTLAWSARDGMLAGTNRGLFRQDKETWRPVAGFDNKVIYAISENKGGERLIGAATGLYDGTGRQVAAGDFRAFAGFQGATYAAVYGRGVLKISSGEAGSLVSNDQTTTTICPGKDRLWIGTAGRGLFSYDGNSVKLEIAPETLKSGTIWNIANAVDGSLWIAGQHGVFRIVDGQVTQIDKTEDVRDVIVIGNTVWAATTTHGLLHIRQDDRFNWLVSAFGFEQGLPSEKAFSIMPIEDGLLIATNRGVVTYKPHEIPPKIIPTRILGQRAHDLAELSGKIDLEYPQNSLLVEVAGQSSRTFPEEFQYAFVLTNGKGEEVARQLSNEPQYAPSDLKPGDYTIEAIAFNRDLLPSEPLFIRFSVAKSPFPWTATALGILLAIAIVGLVWAIIEHRRIAQRNRELAAARFDLANEAERERRRIARDLHDQTLADLRNLMLLSDRISPDKPEFRAEIESVSSEIRRICEDLSPSVLENVGLIASLEFLLKRTIENSEFTAADDLEDRIALSMNAQLQVYRIAQEVLTNIKKHSTADRVEMSVSVSADKHLRLTIRDNGAPFSNNGKKSEGRGIANIRARATLIKARASWSAEKGKGNGNRFSLEVDA
jgi:signal transduction histidine kinase/ligand-binding sensor domain-containing protein